MDYLVQVQTVITTDVLKFQPELTTVAPPTCESRWTVAIKSIYSILTRSIVFTRTTVTSVNVVRLAIIACKRSKN